MMERIVTYVAIGGVLLLGACSSSTDSGGGNGGGTTPSDDEATINASAPDTLTNGEPYHITVEQISDTDGLETITIEASRGGQADTTITFEELSGTTWSKTVPVGYRRSRSELPEDFVARIEVIDSNGNTYRSDALTTHVAKKALPQATYIVSGAVSNANTTDPVDGAAVEITRNGTPVASGQTESQGTFAIGVSQDQDSVRSYSMSLQKAGYQDFSQPITISGADEDVGGLQLAPQVPRFTATLGLSVNEGDSIWVASADLSEIVDFQEAQQDTIYLTTDDPNLRVRGAQGGFWVKAEQGYSGPASITQHAKSSTAGISQQTENLTIKNLPEGTFTIINNVTDQQVPGYILLEQDGAVIDSVASQTGQITGLLLPPDSVTVRAAELKNGEAYSFEHRKKFVYGDADVTATMATINRDRRDINKNKTGEYTINEMVNKLRRLGIEVHGNAPWVPLNENGGTDFPGILHRATESANGIGYDKIIVPDTVNVIGGSGISRMEPQVPDRVDTEYTSQIKPLMGAFGTPLEFPEYYTYDTNNRTPNIGVFLPREDLADAFGLVAVKGKEPYTNTHTYTAISSDPDGNAMSDYKEGQTILQEMTNGLIYFSKLAPNDFSPEILGPAQSIIHDSTNRTTLSDYDRSMGWIVYEPTFEPGEKMGDIMYIPNSWK